MAVTPAVPVVTSPMTVGEAAELVTETLGEAGGGLVGTAPPAVGGLGNGGNSSPRHDVVTAVIEEPGADGAERRETEMLEASSHCRIRSRAARTPPAGARGLTVPDC